MKYLGEVNSLTHMNGYFDEDRLFSLFTDREISSESC